MIGKLDTLYKVLQTTEKQVEYISENINAFYRVKEEPKTDQFERVLFDSNGEPITRILNPSKKKLKSIQKLLVSRVFSQIVLPKELHGSIKKKSGITNAKTHQGNKYFLLTDLRNYFPSIHFSLVYETLLRHGFSPSVASSITRLTTYNKCVPQGAPTSPFISNLVFLPFDEELIEISRINGLKYTRYIDDLTFSSKMKISKPLASKIFQVLKKSPFRYHHRKTILKSGITEVTGVLVKNNSLDIPERKLLKLGALELGSDKSNGLINYIDQVRTK